MNAETTAVRDFLAGQAPFDSLPPDALQSVARAVDAVSVRQGEVVLTVGQKSEHLYVIRSGAVELRDPEGHLIDRLGEGEAFGYPSLLTNAPAARRVMALEDALLYRLPAEAFHALRHAHDSVDRFFAQAHAARIRVAVTQRAAAAALTEPVRSILSRPPVSAAPDLSVQEAARRMLDERVSSLIVHADSGLAGIVTDRDFRSRVVADGLGPDTPLEAVMTPDPVTIGAEALAFEALLLMTQHNLRHLPVVEDGRPIGMVTATDLMQRQASNPVYLVGDVRKARSPEALAEIGHRLPELFVHLVESDTSARDTGRVVSTVSDALTRRLIELAEEELGPPPVPYAWLALGSHARLEQTAHSDQDHALLLDDAFQPEAHGAYFHDFAAAVTDGLRLCGFDYCHTGVMATTDRWRQPLAGWRRTFKGWIESPRAKSLLHAGVFFDFRTVHGAAPLAEALRQEVLERTRGNKTFLAAMVQASQEHQPPLGFFRRFVLERSGEHKDRFDLKLRGVIPVVELARIYALAAGRPEVNTWERLRAAAQAGALSASDAANLADALEFIADIRLRHQAAQITHGEKPDTWVQPDALSPFERRHLRDAFKIVSAAQDSLVQHYFIGHVVG